VEVVEPSSAMSLEADPLGAREEALGGAQIGRFCAAFDELTSTKSLVVGTDLCTRDAQSGAEAFLLKDEPKDVLMFAVESAPIDDDVAGVGGLGRSSGPVLMLIEPLLPLVG